MQEIHCARIFLAASLDQGRSTHNLTPRHLPIKLLSKRAERQVCRGDAAENGNYQWAQSVADLDSQRATTGINNVVKVRREKNMAMCPRNVIKTFQLQGYIPP